ncbi:MAG: hypothetical protein J5857_01605 [Treponema sp.]|nr:hypothetical protein [Treponema sp.]
MSIAFGIGLVVGLAVVLVTVVLIKRKGMKGSEYDERQIAARGRAFRGGFITFVLAEVVVFIIEIFTGEPLVIGVPGILGMLICLLASLVFVEVSIFSDAYFTPNKSMPKAWYVIMTVLGISFIVKFFLDNDDWYRIMNLAAGIFIVIIMASLLVKKLMSKKEEKDQDQE